MAKWFTKRNVFIILGILLFSLICIYILPVSIPIILALLTALLIDPVVKLAEKRFNWTRRLAVISVYIFILAILSILLYYTVTRLIGKIIDFTVAAPSYFNTLSGVWIDTQNKIFQFTDGMPADVVNAIQNEFKAIFDSVRIAILELVNYEKIMALVTDIPSFLVSLIVYMIALFLFMLELPKLKNKVFEYMTDATAEKVRFMVVKLNTIVFGFFKAQLLVSLIIFAISFIGLLLIIPKHAFTMSVVIWIIDLIPILGSIIILAPWALYLLVSGDIATGTQLAILAAVLLIVRRTVEPKVMGSQIGLNPLPTLIAMFIGLKILGFLGFFIGPLAVILFTTAREAGIIRINFKI